tara:strand:+ start:1240 stop:1602 length:363 start_codon:yes stop_codon:yes gene_type:complete
VDGSKKTYPKGIYSSYKGKGPDFVVTTLKIDCKRAMEELVACDQPYLYLQVLTRSAPDKYDVIHNVVVNDYMMDYQRQNAMKGLQQAKQVLEQPKPSAEEDDLPLPTFGTSNEDEDDIPF